MSRETEALISDQWIQRSIKDRMSFYGKDARWLKASTKIQIPHAKFRIYSNLRFDYMCENPRSSISGTGQIRMAKTDENGIGETGAINDNNVSC